MKSDIPVKRILQVRPEDWQAFLFPSLTNLRLTDFPTEIVPKKSSRLDNIKFINDTFISHIEPNGYLDYGIPARMLRYRADIWEYTLSHNMGMPPVNQTLVLFYEKHDNKTHEITDNYFESQGLEYRYRVIKVWELDPSDIINRKLIGLYPLLPLMRYNAEKTGEQIITESVQIIQSVPNEALQSDLLSAMSILASERFSAKLILNFVKKERLMSSEFYKEFVEVFVIEAEQRGEQRGKEIGKELTTLEIAKTMLAFGDPVEKIAAITKLPADKILALV